jgi:microcystin-dependent protein
MPVSIVTRIGKGAPLTAVEHDQNLTNLKAAVDDATLAVTGRVTTSEFDSAFEGEDGDGKKKVSWDNVTDVPVGFSMPTGAVIDYAGAVAPSGYLLCDGSAVSRTTYAALFAILGTVYGAGDATSTFNVPDFRGRTAVGSGSGTAPGATTWTLGQTKGSETQTLTEANLPAHNHRVLGFDDPDDGDCYGLGTNNGRGLGGRGINSADTNYFEENVGGEKFIEDAGGGTGHNNLQPSLTVNKIIKT